jgi:hypothetical protein
MQTVNVYTYKPTIQIQVVGDFNIRTRNRQLYSSNVKLYKGVNNPIRFVCKNQDQKPVEINGFDLVVDLIDASDDHIVETYIASIVNQTKGICQINVTASTLSVIESRYFYFSVAKRVTDTIDEVTYIDDNYSVRLPVEVLPGYVTASNEELDLGSITDNNTIPLVDLGTL